jgi:hypothetical protein
MKKEPLRKLNLVRETLAPLQTQDLEQVQGGAESQSVGASRSQVHRSVQISQYSVSVGRSQSVSVSIPRLW